MLIGDKKMNKKIIVIAIISMFLLTSISVASAETLNSDEDKKNEDPEPESDLVWKSLFGICNLNLPAGTTIDYSYFICFINCNMYTYIFLGLKISGNWGGTSYIDSLFKKRFDFNEDEYYEVNMKFASITTDFEIDGDPFVLQEGAKFLGNGYIISICQ